jgi:hypothetical protein
MMSFLGPGSYRAEAPSLTLTVVLPSPPVPLANGGEVAASVFVYLCVASPSLADFFNSFKFTKFSILNFHY